MHTVSTSPQKYQYECVHCYIFVRLRAHFGSDVKANAVHGSSNPDQAKKNMELLFGEMEFNPDGTLKGIGEHYSCCCNLLRFIVHFFRKSLNHFACSTLEPQLRHFYSLNSL